MNYEILENFKKVSAYSDEEYERIVTDNTTEIKSEDEQ